MALDLTRTHEDPDANRDALDRPGGTSEAAALAASTADELASATEAAIASARARIAELVAGAGDGASAIALLELFDEASADLSNVGALAGLIAKCHTDAAMRDAADAAEQEISKVMTDLSLDPEVYQALASLDVSAANAGTRHYVEKTLREFRRAGVDRDDATRARVRTLQDELVTIGQAFDRNIRADTKSAALPPAALDGLPADYVRSHPTDDYGVVRITTDYPDYLPFMMYARDAGAREQLWRLFRQRAYPANTDVLRSLAERRHELATLLGYPTWAAYVTEDKMIGSADAAGEFVARITDASGARAARDYDALLSRKRADQPDVDVVNPWDTAFLEDRLKAEKLAFDTQAV